ncbi:uncharacterized protein BdWA1_004014, partial [Babesia duncani]
MSVISDLHDKNVEIKKIHDELQQFRETYESVEERFFQASNIVLAYIKKHDDHLKIQGMQSVTEIFPEIRALMEKTKHFSNTINDAIKRGYNVQQLLKICIERFKMNPLTNFEKTPTDLSTFNALYDNYKKDQVKIDIVVEDIKNTLPRRLEINKLFWKVIENIKKAEPNFMDEFEKGSDETHVHSGLPASEKNKASETKGKASENVEGKKEKTGLGTDKKTDTGSKTASKDGDASKKDESKEKVKGGIESKRYFLSSFM